MAACPMLDFGAMPNSTERADKTLETDAQEIQNDSRFFIPESGERLKNTHLFDLSGQSEKMLKLPFSITSVANQIESLPVSEDVDVHPTSFAHLQTKRFVLAAYVSMFSSKADRVSVLPHPIIGTDDVGGILISWTSGNKYVAAKFGAQHGLKSFLYSEQGAEHQALELNEKNLLEKLTWLSE